ncbi:MAG TPA: UDP-glucose 4-epimerase GalE [Azospirillum sp.]|nr:UDP-glucose 4-epimerase GalE [Azospirillum sp.]
MDKQTVLVTGGAGYVGSHAAFALLDAGYRVVVLDDLSTGHREAVPGDAVFVQADVGDGATVGDTIGRFGVSAVMHFAGSIVVPESVEKPLDYYRNNTINSHALVGTCIAAGVQAFLFSSTAAVYGAPEAVPITETAPTRPVNPYGASKLMTERMLADAAAAHGLRYACLRYFNVAGADPAGRAGQSSRVATHLIKIACQTALGLRARMSVFGDDYPTPDGTCIRDYIHVTDLVTAHVQTLSHLLGGGDSFIANCGYGRGYSVKQILETVERVIGRPLPVDIVGRRAGDPPELVADSTLLRRTVGWTPAHDDLDLIIRSALNWEESLIRNKHLAPVG